MVIKSSYGMTKKQIAIVGGVLVLATIAAAVLLGSTSAQRAPQVKANEIVELKNGDTYMLTASYITKEIGGREQKMLAYNGMIPGPTIRVQQGAEITVDFKNETDMPALLHSHGVRMDYRFDGAQTSQEEIEPGQSFSYTLKFPDAGVYWYHPHANEVYGQPLGLYGAYVVMPTDEDYFPPVNREEVVFLSDLLMDGGRIAIDKRGDDFSLMGHFGNLMLVNGQENYVLRAKKGEVVRLYVINAANVRPFNFAIKGMKMKLIGGDSGAYEKATWQESVLLSPSERAIVDVMFTIPTTIINDTPAGLTALGSVVIDPGQAGTSYASQFGQLQDSRVVKDSIDTFRPYFNRAPDRRIALTLDMGMGGGPGTHMMPNGTAMSNTGMAMGVPTGGIEWEDDMAMMNSMSNTQMVQWHIVDQDTGKKDMDIDWTFSKGAPVKIRIFNDPQSMHPMQHPIHFHGQRFLVVARDGVAQTNLGWKDTVLVKAGETVDIVLDTTNPGIWMAHCHIAEHLAAGMMFAFKVQ